MLTSCLDCSCFMSRATRWATTPASTAWWRAIVGRRFRSSSSRIQMNTSPWRSSTSTHTTRHRRPLNRSGRGWCRGGSQPFGSSPETPSRLKDACTPRRFCRLTAIPYGGRRCIRAYATLLNPEGRAVVWGRFARLRSCMHVVIAGNGVLALTAALRLAVRLKPGDRISIIGKATRPGSATLSAAAMLNSFAEIEAGSLKSELELYRFELSHLATRMWPRFVREIIEAAGPRVQAECSKCQGPCRGCFDQGTYIINNTAADDLDDENFDAIVEGLVKFHEPHELVSPRSIPNYKPAQRHRATRAVYLPNEGWLNPRLMIEFLEAALLRHSQVRFIEGVVDRL